MPRCLQQLRGPVVLFGAAVALAALTGTEMTVRAARPEVQRLQIHRVQRRRPAGLLKLGDPPRIEEVPAPVDADRTALDSLTGVIDIEFFQAVVDTEMSEVKLAHGENASTITAVQQRSVSEVFLRDIQDVFYLLPVKLGTPNRSATLIIDTGSSDLWVKRLMGSDLYGDTKYSTGASTSFRSNASSTYEIRYGKGEVAGSLGTDTCCLQSLCIDQEPFIVADKVEDIGNDEFFDGLLGLGFPNLAQCKDCSFVHQVIGSKKYDSFAFGLLLAHEYQDSYVEFGELDMLNSGAKDTFGDSVTLNLYGFRGKASYWMTKPEEVQIGERAISGMEILTIADSGTSLITVPEDQYNLIWPAILSEESVDAFPARGCSNSIPGGNGMTLCVCGKTKLLPLSIVYRDVSGKTSMKITLEQDELLPPDAFAVYGESIELCRPALTIGPKTFPFWLLGDVFMRRVYAIHDVQKMKMHLYPSRANSSGSVNRVPFSGTYGPPDPGDPGVSHIVSSWRDFIDGLYFFANVLVASVSFLAVLWFAWRCCSFWKGSQAREDVYSQLLS